MRGAEQMTYKAYILTRGIKDSETAYRSYLAEYDFIYKLLNEQMREQYAERTYKYRFCKNV